MTQDSPKYPISFPLDDVEIIKAGEISRVENPIYSNNWMSISGPEFSMTVKNVGSFYAGHGTRIEYSPDENAAPAAIELYMNGSVYGAILHQRRILPLHGSSFSYNGSGVLFCGDSGAGKSSLTTSFCLNGAGFLTDDVTPILYQNEKPHIWPKSGKVKLWDDSLQQLKQEKNELTKIRPEDEKYYFPMDSKQVEAHPLNCIFILEIVDSDEVMFERVEKIEAFTYLHQEIYRREYIGAMPEAEAAYLEQISSICNYATIVKVHRPKSISIEKMHSEIEMLLHLL